MANSRMGAKTRSRAFDRAEGDRGAALVEFALLLPLLVAILLGIFTGGQLYNQKLAITNGVREGSRYGATLAVAASSCTSGSGTIACWLANVADVAQSGSENELAATATNMQLCVAYVYPSGTTASDRTTKLVRTSGGDSITTGSTCFSDGRANTERRVQVEGSHEGSLEYLVATAKPTLTSRSVTRFEAG